MTTLMALLALPFTAEPTTLDLQSFNSPENEISIAFSADLSEAWIERRAGEWGEDGQLSRLLYSRRDPDTGTWSGPSPTPFGSPKHDEGDPFYDDATGTLYFTSDRPHPDLPESAANVWRVQRMADGWGRPEALPAPVNGPGAEYSPVRRGNRLYFASYRDGGGDLYMARETDIRWVVEKLGPAINGPRGEWNLWVSETEDLILLEASGRETNVTVSGDLYASVIDARGDWLPAVPMRALNGPGSDLNGQVVGEHLIYASTSAHKTHADLYSAPGREVRRAVEAAYLLSLMVVNRSSHSVSIVDLLSGQTRAEHAIGPGPHLVSQFRGRVAVAAYGVYPRPHSAPVDTMPGWVEEPGGKLLITGTDGSTTHLRCDRPHGTAWDHQGRRLWVTCEDRHGVVEIDFREDQPSHRLIRTRRPGAHVLAWDAARKQLLVAHTGAGGVAFVDPISGNTDFLEIAPGTEALWIDPERPQAWATVGPAGVLSLIDLDARTERRRIDPGCAFPIDFALTVDGRLWVACFGSSEIIAMDNASHEVLDRLPLPAGPLNIEPHPLLPVIYASLPRQNRVVEISLVGRGITRSFHTGIEPDGLTVVNRPALVE